MKVLISPVSMDEAAEVVSGGADIVDIKNTKEGSLGAQFPWVVASIVEFVHANGLTASATLGDLPFKPGTAALAAYGAATCGVDYIKAGLHGMNTYDEALAMMQAIRKAVDMVRVDATVVASGYADYRRFGGLSLTDLVRAAKDARCDVVMVDTAIKDGKNLFDALSLNEIQAFINDGHAAGMEVALAGSIKAEHAEDLIRVDADIVGVRGAVCEGPSRETRISAEKTRTFVQLFHDAPSRAASA